MSFFDEGAEEETLELDQRAREFMFPSGNEELDRSIGGGFPYRSLALIVGPQASGKTIVVQQLCYGALLAGKSVCYISSQQLIEDLVTNMRNLSWDITDYMIEGKFRVIPVYTQSRKVLESPWLLETLEDTILDQDADIIVVDALAHFARGRDEKRVTSFFVTMKGLCGQGKTVMVCIPSYFIEYVDYEHIKAVCTIVFEISMKEQKDNILRLLKLLKFQTMGEKFQQIIPIEIDPAVGIRISAIMEA